MRDLQLLLFQIDEACRYIQDNRTPQLRLALLLLDNAIELQMDWRISDHFQHEEIQERLYKLVLDIPEQERTSELKEITKWNPLNRKEKKKAIRYFNERINILLMRYAELDISLGKVAMYLHRYRNEAYHHGKIRHDTIATAVRIFLDVACEFLLSIQTHGHTYSSADDYSWLEDRFGIKAMDAMLNDEFVRNVVTDFRKKAKITEESVKKSLADNIKDRVAGVIRILNFVVSNTQIADVDSALQESRNHMEKYSEFLKEAPLAQKENYSMDFIKVIEERANKIYSAGTKIEAFREFAVLEAEFEPIESAVVLMSDDLERAIQQAIDIARGK